MLERRALGPERRRPARPLRHPLLRARRRGLRAPGGGRRGRAHAGARPRRHGGRRARSRHVALARTRRRSRPAGAEPAGERAPSSRRSLTPMAESGRGVLEITPETFPISAGGARRRCRSWRAPRGRPVSFSAILDVPERDGVWEPVFARLRARRRKRRRRWSRRCRAGRCASTSTSRPAARRSTRYPAGGASAPPRRAARSPGAARRRRVSRCLPPRDRRAQRRRPRAAAGLRSCSSTRPRAIAPRWSALAGGDRRRTRRRRGRRALRYSRATMPMRASRCCCSTSTRNASPSCCASRRA